MSTKANNEIQLLIGAIYRSIEKLELPEESVAELRRNVLNLDHTINRGNRKILPINKNKYSREIKPHVWVDIYDVLRAFPTGCSAMDHAAKKVLAAGKRGHKDTIEDKEDIIKSVRRSLEIDKEWEAGT